jgi:uncharacterized protein with PIN domain
MFVGAINRGISVDGFIKSNCLEPLSIVKRHEELVEEMKRRGYNHNSTIIEPDLSKIPNKNLIHTINKKESFNCLITRCESCKVSYEKMMKGIV